MTFPPRAALAAALMSMLASPFVHADPAATAPLPQRALAATCAACHGTDGNAQAGGAMVALRGRDGAELLAQLTAFRDGTRPSTVMQQIARGYTPAQLEQIAAYFAALPKVSP